MNRDIAEELAFNFRAHGRHGRTGRVQITPAQARMVARTAARAPEVMVKVLSSGACSAKAVQRHIDYVSRKGKVEMIAEDGQATSGRGAGESVAYDWSLRLEEAGATNVLGSQCRKDPPRLVHKLVFSMPPGTNPQKVLAAVQNFAREEFALKNRYVMALHTDEPHPHVHVIVKAMSEDGRRLNIKKAHLKEWRVKFAHHLRQEGVAANATPRPFRDQAGHATPSAIYRLRIRQREAVGLANSTPGRGRPESPQRAPRVR